MVMAVGGMGVAWEEEVEIVQKKSKKEMGGCELTIRCFSHANDSHAY